MTSLSFLGAVRLGLVLPVALVAVLVVMALVLGYLAFRMRLVLKVLGNVCGMLRESEEGVLTIRGRRYVREGASR